MPLRRAIAALALSALPLLGLGVTATPAAAATALSDTSVFALAGFGGRIWAATDNGLYTLASGSSTWSAVGGAFDGRQVNALAVAGGWLVAGTEDGAVRTRDGSSWSGAGLLGERVASLSFGGGVLLAGTGHDTPADGVVQRSDDDGGSWTSAPVSPALIGLPGDTVQAVLTPSGANAAWAGTAGGGAFHSGDGKGAWAPSTGMQTSWVTAFWRDPASPARVLAGSDDGLYTWSGSSWSAASFPQADPWVQALATGDDGHAVAGTYDGDVFSQGAGGAWTRRATGLPSVLSLLAVGSGGIMVGTADGVACAGCPANLAAAATSPGAHGARPAPTLPPPGARAGSSARPGTTAAPQASTSAVPGATPETGAVGSTSPGGGGSSGGSLRWWIVGGLVALSAVLLALGRLRGRRAETAD